MGRRDEEDEVKEGKSSKRDDRKHHRTRHRRDEIKEEEKSHDDCDGVGGGDDGTPSRGDRRRHDKKRGEEDRTTSRRHRRSSSTGEKKGTGGGSRDYEPHEKEESHRRERKRSRHHNDIDNDDQHTKPSKHDKKDKKEKSRRHRHHRNSSSGAKDKADNKTKGRGTSGSNLLPLPQFPLGEPLGHPPDRLLDADRDYFAYHEHFWVYLFREERTAFNDLISSDASRAAFARFAARYNAGSLPAAYYDPRGLPAAALDESKTTQHQWKFRTSDAESKRLQALQEGVRKQTEYVVDSPKDTNNHPPTAKIPMATMPSVAQQRDDPARTARDRTLERREHKRMREHVRTVQEELAGGPKDYRERQIEKRKQVGERMHSATRERGAAVELSDEAIYGGAEDSGFRTALAREKDRRANREEKQRSRMEELQRKEQAKQDEMLKRLGLTGLKPGQKIKIAPRSDEA